MIPFIVFSRLGCYKRRRSKQRTSAALAALALAAEKNISTGRGDEETKRKRNVDANVPVPVYGRLYTVYEEENRSTAAAPLCRGTTVCCLLGGEANASSHCHYRRSSPTLQPPKNLRFTIAMSSSSFPTKVKSIDELILVRGTVEINYNWRNFVVRAHASNKTPSKYVGYVHNRTSYKVFFL